MLAFLSRHVTLAGSAMAGVVAFPALAIASDQAGTTAGAVKSSVPDVVFFSVPVVAFVVCLLAIGFIRSALAKSAWSLSDAVSEEIEITAMDKQDPPQPILGKDGNPMKITVMRASSSRVTALMGTVVILIMYLGFGIFALYSFGANGTLPDDATKSVIKFLLSGMSLFAPYLVNKFASVFNGLGGK